MNRWEIREEEGENIFKKGDYVMVKNGASWVHEGVIYEVEFAGHNGHIYTDCVEGNEEYFMKATFKNVLLYHKFSPLRIVRCMYELVGSTRR